MNTNKIIQNAICEHEYEFEYYNTHIILKKCVSGYKSHKSMQIMYICARIQIRIFGLVFANTNKNIWHTLVRTLE